MYMLNFDIHESKHEIYKTLMKMKKMRQKQPHVVEHETSHEQ